MPPQPCAPGAQKTCRRPRWVTLDIIRLPRNGNNTTPAGAPSAIKTEPGSNSRTSPAANSAARVDAAQADNSGFA